ncbi:hypothetical protein Vafri_5236, partial [Volvox africanus]
LMLKLTSPPMASSGFPVRNSSSFAFVAASASSRAFFAASSARSFLMRSSSASKRASSSSSSSSSLLLSDDSGSSSSASIALGTSCFVWPSGGAASSSFRSLCRSSVLGRLSPLAQKVVTQSIFQGK